MNLTNILNRIFSSDKNLKDFSRSVIENEITPEEHIDFANGAIDILNPFLKQFGFKLIKMELDEFGSTLVWLKGKCYVYLRSNTHPHDAPAYYGILLGEFKEDHYHYADLDVVGLWRLKAIHEKLESVSDAAFPYKADIIPSLQHTKNDLLKYAIGFLEGDLTRFHFARNVQWNQHQEG